MFQLEHVKKRYSPTSEYVLDDISFKIDRGEIIGVLGENGAGKTTMIKSMLKLLEIDEGSIICKGNNIWQIKDKEYYKVVASVLEGNRNLYWYLSGYENIMYFCSLGGLRKKDIKERAEEYLKLLGLYDARNRCVSEYSRGMQQKLSIIIALMGKPEILFLDEPTLGLDVQTKKSVIEILKKLSCEEGVTIFITSHQLDVIDLLADKLLVLQNHKIIYEGKPYTFKQKYSKNKYLISFISLEPIEECMGYKAKKEGEIYTITMESEQNDQAMKVLLEMQEKGYEVISFQKDTSSLEEIMLHFLKEEG